MEIIDFLIHPEVLDVFADDPKSSTHHSSAAGKKGPCKSGARRKIVSVAAVPEINIRKGRCIVRSEEHTAPSHLTPPPPPTVRPVAKKAQPKPGLRRKIVSVAAVPEINIRKGRCIV